MSLKTFQSPGFINFTECLATIGLVTMEASMALTSSFWELNINLFSLAISGPYYFFLENIGMAFAEGTIMGSSMLLFGSFGCNGISSSMSVLINILMQGCTYIEMIDPAAYAEIMIEYEMMVSLELEINTELSHCKNDFSPLWHSCGYGPYWKLSMFIYQFAFIFNRIILIWCDICSVMPDFCENPFTTTTVSSTTSVINFLRFTR